MPFRCMAQKSILKLMLFVRVTLLLKEWILKVCTVATQSLRTISIISSLVICLLIRLMANHGKRTRKKFIMIRICLMHASTWNWLISSEKKKSWILRLAQVMDNFSLFSKKWIKWSPWKHNHKAQEWLPFTMAHLCLQAMQALVNPISVAILLRTIWWMQLYNCLIIFSIIPVSVPMYGCWAIINKTVRCNLLMLPKLLTSCARIWVAVTAR